MQKEAVIHVDLDDPRISTTEGEPVFLPQGGNSRYLDRIVGILNGIRTGLEVSKAMFAAFTAADLIEPVKIEVKFNSEEQYDLLGLHTINQKKLAELDAETLHKLNRSGFLQGAFLVTVLVGQRAAAHRHEGPPPPASGRERVVNHHAFPEVRAVGDEFLVDRVILVDLLSGEVVEEQDL